MASETDARLIAAELDALILDYEMALVCELLCTRIKEQMGRLARRGEDEADLISELRSGYVAMRDLSSRLNRGHAVAHLRGLRAERRAQADERYVPATMRQHESRDDLIIVTVVTKLSERATQTLAA